MTIGRETGKYTALSSLSGDFSAPFVHLYLDSRCFTGLATVAVVPDLPTKEADFILGNDLAGSRVGVVPAVPVLCEKAEVYAKALDLETSTPHLFPQCTVTRSAAAKRRDVQE